MELIYDSESSIGLACALVGTYAKSQINDKPCLFTAIGSKSRSQVSDTLFKKAPVCLLADSNIELHEPVSIIQFLCQHSIAKDALLGSESSKPKEHAIMMQWITLCSSFNFQLNQADKLNEINSCLLGNAFLTGSCISVSDLVVFVSLYKTMAGFSNKELLLFTNISRWFNHMQNLPGIKGILSQLPMIQTIPVTSFDLLKVIPDAKKENSKENNKDNNKDSKKEGNKDSKKENKKEKKKDNSNAVADTRPIDDVMRLEMRVGQVIKVWKHPDAESLYCEEVDLGPLGVRSIASGLVKYISADQLLNQKVVVLANLKEKPLRGFPSHGMLLCASHKESGQCELLNPPHDTPLGERVIIGNLSGEPDGVLSSKSGKDTFGAVQPHFNTNDSCGAMYKDLPFMTSKGPVACKSIKGGTIS